MLKIFNISCEQANTICNKAQYGEASFKEKLQLKFHLLVCKFCALYSRQNSTITEICKNKSKDCKEKTHKLSDKDKELLKKEFKKMNS